MTNLGAPLAEKPTPAPKLQKDLTELIYKRNQAALLDAAAARDLTRLQSVLAPHATAWIDGSGMLPPLTAEQYRCALKWVLGIPLRRDDYCCTACGTIPDKWGVHATSCLATGTIGRAHTTVKTAFGTLCSQAGWHVQYEQPIPGTQGEKIMDLVVTGTPNSQTMAFNVTVVNPVAPSGPEVVRAASPGTAMDEVERRKQMKYEQPVKEWDGR